jgi:hypothetical protein
MNKNAEKIDPNVLQLIHAAQHGIRTNQVPQKEEKQALPEQLHHHQKLN